jgi:F-type H+-transporting ATPase subunit b
MLKIVWPELITNILGFLLLFWGLKRFAWGPILGLLEERRERIRKDFDAAEEATQDAEGLRADYQGKLKEIDAVGRKRIEEATQDALRVAAEMKEKAREESNAILQKGQADIERERAKARVALRNDMVQMVMHGTEKILKEKVTGTKQEELVGKFIDELENVRAQAR